MLHCPPALVPSSRSTTSATSKCRPGPGTWCFTARQALFIRRGAPRPPPQNAGRVRRRGASLPASPYFFVDAHHVPPLKVPDGPGDVVLHYPPALISSSASTTSATSKCRPASGTWCFTARQPLFLRQGAPRPAPNPHHVLRRQPSPPISGRPSHATGCFKISIFLDKCVMKGNFFYGIIIVRRYTI